jgi:hypothetical protein
MDRRRFLKYASATGLAVAAPSLLTQDARSNPDDPTPYTGPLFVILEASGGWDVTMSFDPKGIETGLNRTYDQGDILTSGAIAYAPGIASQTIFFEKNYQDLIAINGINVATNSHPAGLRYTWTGRSDNANYPTFAALVAAVYAPDAATPYLALGGYASDGGVVPTSRIAHASHFNTVSEYDTFNGSDTTFVREGTRGLMDQARQQQSDRRRRHFNSPQSNRTRDAMFMTQNSMLALKQIKEFIPDDLQGGGVLDRAAIGFASYKAGACVSMNLKLGGNFDSHDANDARQLTCFSDLFEGAQAILDLAETFDIRDDIVLLISSDFSRTPKYNTGQGKDHWSVGSMLLMGPGIQGNRVIGATDEGQFSMALDSTTLQVSDAPDAVVLRPEHIHMSLRRYASIHEHPYCTNRFHLRGDELGLF